MHSIKWRICERQRPSCKATTTSMGSNRRSNTENGRRSRLLEENKSFLRALSSSWTLNVAKGLSDFSGTGSYAARTHLLAQTRSENRSLPIAERNIWTFISFGSKY